MRVIKTIHRHVNPKTGVLETGGAVHTEKGVSASWNEGCGLSDCHCSDGYWLCINLGATKINEMAINDFDHEVEVITIHFDSREEMESHLGIRKEAN